MSLPEKAAPDLERGERNLTIFVCSMLLILAVGTAVLMYPVVFSRQGAGDTTLRTIFVGFCALCGLLAAYIWNRHTTIVRLRREMAEERRRVIAAQTQASEEILKTMPKLSSFRDRLPMEYRRTVATTHKLSVVVVNLKLPAGSSAAAPAVTALGDAAKVISRKLREQDSIYMLSPSCFGVVLPGVDMAAAHRVSQRISEGLADAAGASNRFSCAIEVVNYPAHASSAHELEQAVQALIPGENSMQAIAEEALR